MAIRLKDIARELDVFIITVSKALLGNTDISEATRQRVLERVKELDYQPNMMARSLATGHRPPATRSLLDSSCRTC